MTFRWTNTRPACTTRRITRRFTGTSGLGARRMLRMLVIGGVLGCSSIGCSSLPQPQPDNQRLMTMAQLFENQGDLQMAQTMYYKVLEANPANDQARMRVAAIWKQLDMPTEPTPAGPAGNSGTMLASNTAPSQTAAARPVANAGSQLGSQPKPAAPPAEPAEDLTPEPPLVEASEELDAFSDGWSSLASEQPHRNNQTTDDAKRTSDAQEEILEDETPAAADLAQNTQFAETTGETNDQKTEPADDRFLPPYGYAADGTRLESKSPRGAEPASNTDAEPAANPRRPESSTIAASPVESDATITAAARTASAVASGRLVKFRYRTVQTRAASRTVNTLELRRAEPDMMIVQPGPVAPQNPARQIAEIAARMNPSHPTQTGTPIIPGTRVHPTMTEQPMLVTTPPVPPTGRAIRRANGTTPESQPTLAAILRPAGNASQSASGPTPKPPTAPPIQLTQAEEDPNAPPALFLQDAPDEPTEPTIEIHERRSASPSSITPSVHPQIQSRPNAAAAEDSELARLRRQLDDPDVGARILAAFDLGERGREAEPAIPRLIELVRTEQNEQARVLYAESIAKIRLGDATALIVLSDALNEGSPRVQELALLAVHNVLKEMRAALERGDSVVTRYSLKEFSRRVGPAVRRGMYHESQVIRTVAKDAAAYLE